MFKHSGTPGGAMWRVHAAGIRKKINRRVKVAVISRVMQSDGHKGSRYCRYTRESKAPTNHQPTAS